MAGGEDYAQGLRVDQQKSGKTAHGTFHGSLLWKCNALRGCRTDRHHHYHKAQYCEGISDHTAVVASAGVAISLALKGGLSNFAGGILILLLRPFQTNDYIIVPSENVEGSIRKIELYYTDCYHR